MLLDRAQAAGAQLERTRVLRAERKGRGWSIETKHGAAEADFCIMAAGARNPLKNMGTELAPKDAMTALGYFVPGERTRIEKQFFSGQAGYIRVFPRVGQHTDRNNGKEPASALRSRLEQYM